MYAHPPASAAARGFSAQHQRAARRGGPRAVAKMPPGAKEMRGCRCPGRHTLRSDEKAKAGVWQVPKKYGTSNLRLAIAIEGACQSVHQVVGPKAVRRKSLLLICYTIKRIWPVKARAKNTRASHFLIIARSVTSRGGSLVRMGGTRQTSIFNSHGD
jgi:hypothetical protein